MANTEFFREASKSDSKLGWKDIFSESFKKHSRADVERVLQVGTLARQVPESAMLKTWHRPWLWWRLAKLSLLLAVCLYAAVFTGASNSGVNMMVLIPPLLVPIVVMVLMWELNIPQNISVLDMVGFFVFSAVINFMLTGVVAQTILRHAPMAAMDFLMGASAAPLWEEPAKLAAALLILVYLQKVQHKKIYGMTGLVVGAIVGASFSGFESMSYAIRFSQSIDSLMDVQLTRALSSITGGHIMFCLPYATAAALHCENGKLTMKSLGNADFLTAFAMSAAIHALWNSGLGLITLLQIAGIFILLYWIKRALKQMTEICGRGAGAAAGVQVSTPSAAASGSAEDGELVVYCENSSLQGTFWRSSGQDITIGRDRTRCTLCYSDGANGVSRCHCRLTRTAGGWAVQDLDSSYGTYVGSRKLMPRELCPIQRGDRIYLGSQRVSIRIM